jgi:N-acyl-L-homoserine lactone synthetase
MVAGCERIQDAAQEFEVAIAKTERELEAAFRLRHQVYCIERGYEQGNGGLETDRFDARSRHAILTQRSTGRVVGTVRVVAPSLDGPTADLPVQALCASDMFRMLPMGSTGEVSRFAISKDLRDVACAGNAMLRLGLIRGVIQISGEMQLTHWCAVMEHTLLRLLRLSAIHFQPLGPAIDHHGLRQPSWVCLSSMVARMRRERPAVWDYLTEGGTLWQDEEEDEAEAVFA